MKKITTSVGTSVDLPCTFTTKSKPPTTVEWSKDGAIAIVFRHNMELHDEKHSHFEGRTSFDIKDGKPKTFSLRLCSVQHSDAGVYNCKGLWGEDHKEIQEVELLVDAVNAIGFTFVEGERKEVILECEALSLGLKHNIIFLDDKNNVMKAEEQRRSLQGGVYHTVTRRTTLQPENKSLRVTCRVQQPESDTYTDKEVFIPASCLTQCSDTICVVVGVIAIIIIIPVICAILWGRPGRSCLNPEALKQQTADTSSSSPDPQCEINQLKEQVSSLTAQLETKQKQLEQAEEEHRKKITELEAQRQDNCNTLPVIIPQHDKPISVAHSSSPKSSSNNFPKPVGKPPTVRRSQRSQSISSQGSIQTKPKDHKSSQEVLASSRPCGNADPKPTGVVRSKSFSNFTHIRPSLILTANRFDVLAEQDEGKPLLPLT
ncbi:uncharacterized protein LOC103389665 isoform X2 [Cynoglossus semilaevis]|nr:uncharacterized protein LOC103389665 isoform X2 [Cynoglossus semilaevis]